MIGGAVLHQGNIAEMKTGEGKTLVCTMPIYLNALTEKVFSRNVNDYLPIVTPNGWADSTTISAYP